MIVIADKRIPVEARTRLETHGQVFFLETAGITYPAISGHPDIFFCLADKKLVHAPNAPEELIRKLKMVGLALDRGERNVGRHYPLSAYYNAVVTDKYLVHNLQHTDPVIRKHCAHLQPVHVNQAYTRCNLVPLAGDRFVTSDRGIERELMRLGLEVLYVNPDGILLQGFGHGFIGGTSGVHHRQVFFTGSLKHFNEGTRLRDFLAGHEVVELYEGPLFDGGSLLLL